MSTSILSAIAILYPYDKRFLSRVEGVRPIGIFAPVLAPRIESKVNRLKVREGGYALVKPAARTG